VQNKVYSDLFLSNF